MIQVASHHYTGSDSASSVDSKLDFTRNRLAPMLAKDPGGSGRHISMLEAAEASHLGRLRDAHTLWTSVCECAGAMFAAISAAPGTTVTFPFQGALLSGPSGKAGYNSGPGCWVNSLLFALAIRRQDIIDVLVKVPVSVTTSGPGERDACFIHLMYTFQAFMNGEDFSEPLAEFRRSSQPEHLKVASPRIIEPFAQLLPVLVAISQKDQFAFDETLLGLVKAHKKKFSRASQAGSPEGLIADKAIGLAVLGLERGLSVNVESSYLPAWLLAGGVPS